MRWAVLCIVLGSGACQRVQPYGEDPKVVDTDTDPPEVDALELTVLEAVGGAMWVNPEVQPSITLRMLAPGAFTVNLDFEGRLYQARLIENVWEIPLDVSGLRPGEHPMVFTVSKDASTLQQELILGTGSEGIPITEHAVDGNATTPRVHHAEDALWISWVDRSENGKSRAWLQPRDGAGRPLAERIRIVPKDEEVLHVRTALGDDGTVGVLYQTSGGYPYRSSLQIVDLDGKVIVEPVALDAPPDLGTYYGDIAWDGTGYAVVFRVTDSNGASTLQFAKVKPNGKVIGPKTIASEGADDPDGAFPVFTFTEIMPLASGKYFVTFTRDHYNDFAGLVSNKAQYVVVEANGSVSDQGYFWLGLDWDNEAHVFPTEVGGAFAVWAQDDLGSSDWPPPTELWGRRFKPDGTSNDTVPGHMMLAAPNERGEPFISGDLMAWLDHRSYTADPVNGQIELYVGYLFGGVKVAPVTLTFPHARFVAGLSELTGTRVDDTVVLVWQDQRAGSGIADPRPEIYMEVVWEAQIVP